MTISRLFIAHTPQMSAQIMVMAVLTVAVSALALVPIMLYGLDLKSEGWSAVDVVSWLPTHSEQQAR